MATVSIPLTTLPVGERAFGPVTVQNAHSSLTLSIDRTVVNGFDSHPASTVMEIRSEQSNDGGATWLLVCGGTMVGGLVPAAPPPRGPGGFIATSSVTAEMIPGTGRRIRAVVVLSGAAVAVAGSLTSV